MHTDPLEIHEGSPAFDSGEITSPVHGAILGGVAVGDLDRVRIEEEIKNLTDDLSFAKSDAERANTEEQLAIARAKAQAVAVH